MTRPGLHPTPRGRDVLLEQVRAVGLSIRGPAAAAVAVGAVALLLAAIDVLQDGEALPFRPQQWVLPAFVGLLLPLGVWRGEARSAAGLLWTLPVDRRRHALARVAAGWVWLMAGVAVLVLGLLALALLSGGGILAPETLHVLTSPLPPDADVRAGVPVRTFRWTPEPVLWLVPFTSATATYLLASALALGSTARRIVAVAAGVFLLVAGVSVAGELTGSRWLVLAPSRAVSALVYGQHGLMTLLTGRTEVMGFRTALSPGETVMVWRDLPDVGRWAVATLLWTSAGLASLWAATLRHRERRRR